MSTSVVWSKETPGKWWKRDHWKQKIKALGLMCFIGFQTDKFVRLEYPEDGPQTDFHSVTRTNCPVFLPGLLWGTSYELGPPKLEARVVDVVCNSSSAHKWRCKCSPGSYTCILGANRTWQVALVKLTCHPRIRPLSKSLDEWLLVKSTCQVTLLKSHAQAVPNPPPGVQGGEAVTFMDKKRVKIEHLFIFSHFFVVNCCPMCVAWHFCVRVVSFSVHLVSWSVAAAKTVVSWAAKGTLPKSISITILTSTAWRTLGLLGAFSTLVGGTILRALRFLVVRKINRWNWLAWGYKHCELCYPLAGDLDGSALN